MTTTITDGEFAAAVRAAATKLPLSERQHLAEAMRYLDGKPLTEDDIRRAIRSLRDRGGDRERFRLDVRGESDLAERRIGALNLDEVDAIFDEEWPS